MSVKSSIEMAGEEVAEAPLESSKGGAVFIDESPQEVTEEVPENGGQEKQEAGVQEDKPENHNPENDPPEVEDPEEDLKQTVKNLQNKLAEIEKGKAEPEKIKPFERTAEDYEQFSKQYNLDPDTGSAFLKVLDNEVIPQVVKIVTGMISDSKVESTIDTVIDQMAKVTGFTDAGRHKASMKEFMTRMKIPKREWQNKENLKDALIYARGKTSKADISKVVVSKDNHMTVVKKGMASPGGKGGAKARTLTQEELKYCEEWGIEPKVYLRETIAMEKEQSGQKSR